MILILLSVLHFESSGIVVTSSRYQELPYNIEIIKVGNNATIKSVGELLERKAGIKIKNYGNPGGLSQVTAAGNSPSHTLILLNGHRITDPRTGGFDISALPLNAIDKIEIIKGPSSVIHGSNAVGGIVNFVTGKKGKSFSLTVHSTPGLILSAGNDFEDGYFNLDISGGKGQRDNTEYYRYAGSTGWKNFNIFFSSRKTGTPGPVPDSTYIPVFGSKNVTNLYDSQITNLVDISYRKITGISDLGIIIIPSLRLERMEPRMKYMYFSSGETVIENDEYTTAVGQIDVKFLYRSLTASLHLEQDTIMMHQYFSNGQKETWYAGERNAGLTVSGSRSFGNFILYGSARGDWYRSFGLHPSATAGIRYNGIINCFLSVGSAFRAPTLNDLYWPDYSNPDLEPEESIGLTAGIAKSGLSLSGYVERIDNRIGYGADYKPYNIFKTILYGMDIKYRDNYKNFSYSLTLSFVDGYDDLDSLTRSLQYQPELSASWILNYRGPLSLEVSGKWSGVRRKWLDYPGEWKVHKPFLLMDLSISKNINGLGIGLSTRNIFDTRYRVNFGYSPGDSDYPGYGRYYEFWLRY